MVKLLLLLVLALVAPPGVGVVVYPGVTGQLIGARELLATSRELASVRLLSSVSTDVTGLVLQTVEGLIAERALVGSRQLVGGLGGLSAGERPVGLDNGDGSGSHVAVCLLGFLGVLGS